MSKTYRVKGYAMIPVEVSIEVTGVIRGIDAEAKAILMFNADKQKYIVPGSEDYTAIWDFQKVKLQNYDQNKLQSRKVFS